MFLNKVGKLSVYILNSTESRTESGCSKTQNEIWEDCTARKKLESEWLVLDARKCDIRNFEPIGIGINRGSKANGPAVL